MCLLVCCGMVVFVLTKERFCLSWSKLHVADVLSHTQLTFLDLLLKCEIQHYVMDVLERSTYIKCFLDRYRKSVVVL